MGKIITVCSQKGGCGKTTTVQSLAAGLSFRGNQCLVIDLDPQGNLSIVSDVNEYEYTIYELMKGECSFEAACKVNEFYDIIPADISLSKFNQDSTDKGKEYILKTVLDEIREKYDYILIDTPTSYCNLTINSLTASDYVILTAEQSFYSLYGLEQLTEIISEVQIELNKYLKILGLLVVRYTEKAAINKLLKEKIDYFVRKHGIRMFSTFIHESNDIKFAQGMGKNIIVFLPLGKASREYMKLSDEVDQEFSQEVKKNIV